MAHNTAPDNPQLTVENLNAEQLQKADVIWNQTVDSVRHPSTSLSLIIAVPIDMLFNRAAQAE